MKGGRGEREGRGEGEKRGWRGERWKMGGQRGEEG